MEPIGYVRTEETALPRHWSISDVEGKLIIDDAYREGLSDIEIGRYIVVLFHFHKSPPFTSRLLRQTPPHKNQEMSVFSTCSPRRPNPIGMSVLKVLGIHDTVIHVKHLDMIDGTPIIDIKPHIELERKD